MVIGVGLFYIFNNRKEDVIIEEAPGESLDETKEVPELRMISKSGVQTFVWSEYEREIFKKTSGLP